MRNGGERCLTVILWRQAFCIVWLALLIAAGWPAEPADAGSPPTRPAEEAPLPERRAGAEPRGMSERQPPQGQQPGASGHRESIVWAYYRIGDSPVAANGAYAWTLPESAGGWQRMPPALEEVGDAQHVWFSTVIAPEADGGPADPFLMFSNARYEFELYAGPRLLFSYGDLQDKAMSLLEGRPVFVSLENYNPGEPLFLRIHSRSDDTLAGKLGSVWYGNQAELKLGAIRADLPNAAGVVVFFMIGFVSCLLYFINREQTGQLYFSIFSIMIAVNLIFSMSSLTLFADVSMLKGIAEGPVQGGMAWMFALYFIHVVRPAAKAYIRAAGAALFAAGVLSSMAKLLTPPFFDAHRWEFEVFRNLGFSLLCALCLVSAAVSLRRVFRQGSKDAKWFIGGVSLYLTVNSLGHPLRLLLESHPGRFPVSTLQFIHWLNHALEYSLLFATVFFGVISFRQYAKVYRQTRERNLQLANWNAELEGKVRERTEAIQNLLDNAGQGFLTVSRQLLVKPEYSAECRRLFRGEVAEAPFAALLYPDDPSGRALLSEMLESIFQADDLQREVYFSLLPAEADIHDKRLTIQYKWIPGPQEGEGQLMAILTDITDKRMLEDRMEKERQVLQMVLGMTKYYRDFKEIIGEYRAFAASGMEALLRSPLPPGEKWAEICRVVHTFKGNFAQIEFARTAEKLHELENELSGWKDQLRRSEAEPAVVDRFGAWLQKFDFLDWAEEDLRILREVLGDRFDIGEETITIELERLRRLERQVYAMLPSPEAKTIVSELNKLRYRPIKDLLGMYPDYAMKLANRMGKRIHPIRIEGGETLVDPEKYSEFTRTLIHVFRNMIDHGIESPERRASVGKDPAGMVECRIDAAEEGFRIVLSNDGKELSLPDIRERALQTGVRSAAELEAMDEGDIRMLIFQEGFSTKRGVNAISGRGIGMSAVRKALEALGGSAQIASSRAQGTTFAFFVPRSEP